MDFTAARSSVRFSAPSTCRAARSCWSTPRFGAGSVTLAGDRLVIVRESGELLIAAASPKSFQQVASAQVLPATVRAYPGVVGRHSVSPQRQHAYCGGSREKRLRIPGSVSWFLVLGFACAVVAAQNPQALLNRAVDEFEQGRFAQSASTFDEVAKAVPGQAPYLWQRGIALYYAGRYDDCRRQFESHARSIPDDVENAAWHFLCVAREQSPDKARAALLPVGPDFRVADARGLSDVPGSADRRSRCCSRRQRSVGPVLRASVPRVVFRGDGPKGSSRSSTSKRPQRIDLPRPAATCTWWRQCI